MKISEVIDLLTRRIFDEVKQTHRGIRICTPAECSLTEATELAMLNIESHFSQILNNQEWTWDKILADAKQTCSSSNSKIKLDVGLHPNIVAQHFQVSFYIKC